MMDADERFMKRAQEQLEAWQKVAAIFAEAEAKQARFCLEVMGRPIAEIRAEYRDKPERERAAINAQYAAWLAESGTVRVVA